MISKFKRIIKESSLLNFLWLKVDWYTTMKSIRKDVKSIPSRIYKNVFGKELNWENPKNLIEKIYWLQVYSDTSLWTICADKFAVREFVKERGCIDSLNELYGKWNNVEDIQWENLPSSFVLKTNNSCGQIILVKDKSILKIEETKEKLNKWMLLKYGFRDGQYHYTNIVPCVIAEKLFVNENDPSKSLVDYKIWCFNGEPECILIVFDSTKSDYSLSLYDLEWNNISEKGFKLGNSHVKGVDFPKPKSFDKMIEYAKSLSKGFPQVRVDFYDVNGKAVFGEMTFSTGYGYFSNEYYDYLGNKINLNDVVKLKTPNNPLI